MREIQEREKARKKTLALKKNRGLVDDLYDVGSIFPCFALALLIIVGAALFATVILPAMFVYYVLKLVVNASTRGYGALLTAWISYRAGQ